MNYTARANPANEWGESMRACVQVFRKLPLRHGCVHPEKMCMPIFIAGSMQPSYFVIKFATVAQVFPCKSADFSL